MSQTIKETPAWDIFRCTISKFQPGCEEEKAWCLCHVGRMIQDWVFYADDYRHRYKSGILGDVVLGSAWKDIGLALHGLLSGEIRVNAGTANACITRVLQHEGFVYPV